MFLLRVTSSTLKNRLSDTITDEDKAFGPIYLLAVPMADLELSVSPPGLTRYFDLSKKHRDAMAKIHSVDGPYRFRRQFNGGPALDDLCLEVIKDYVNVLSEVDIDELRAWGWKIERQIKNDGALDRETESSWTVDFPYKPTSDDLASVDTLGMPLFYRKDGGRMWPRPQNISETRTRKRTAKKNNFSADEGFHSEYVASLTNYRPPECHGLLNIIAAS